MKSKLAFVIAVLICALWGANANAQGRFEITPFVGYETSASIPLNPFSGSTTVPVNKLRVNGSVAFGTFADFTLTENTQVEFMWNRNPTSFSERRITNGTYFKAFNSDVDQYQFGLLYTFLNSEHKLRPYIAGGLGFTHASNSGGSSNQTEFAYNIGGGVKYYVSRHVGLRGDVRLLPTYGNSSVGTYCDPFFGCYNAKISNFFNRGSFTGGVIFRF